MTVQITNAESQPFLGLSRSLASALSESFYLKTDWIANSAHGYFGLQLYIANPRKSEKQLRNTGHSICKDVLI
jgi:hypothetical protein